VRSDCPVMLFSFPLRPSLTQTRSARRGKQVSWEEQGERRRKSRALHQTRGATLGDVIETRVGGSSSGLTAFPRRRNPSRGKACL